MSPRGLQKVVFLSDSQKRSVKKRRFDTANINRKS